jgi:hypothetical protein
MHRASAALRDAAAEFGAVMPSTSRSTQSNGMSLGASKVRFSPLICRFMTSLPIEGCQCVAPLRRHPARSYFVVANAIGRIAQPITINARKCGRPFMLSCRQRELRRNSLSNV